MNDWHEIYITDKSGKKFFNTTASPMATMSEIKNLENHIAAAKKNPSAYAFIDIETAVLMLDGTPYIWF